MMNKKIPIRIPSNSTLQIIQRWNKCTNSYTNMEYVKSFKCLDISQMDESMICSAFNNYENISEPKNYFSINKLLKICSSNPMASRKIFILWKDIINTNNIQNIYHGLLLKSCCNILKQKHLSTMEINKCIEILKCILSHNQLTDTIYVYCALINAFGQQRKIKNAFEIFNKLPKYQINVSIIDAMMTAYINNKQYNNAIALYKQYHSIHNKVTHLLAIQSATQIADFQFGQKIISNHVDQNNNINICIKTFNILLEFYATFGQVNNAYHIFQSIPKDKLHVSNLNNKTNPLNTMMTCFLKNDYNDKCLQFYQQQSDDMKDHQSHLLSLQACCKVNNYQFARDIISIYFNYNNKNYPVKILTKLIQFYGQCKDINAAENVFQSIPKNKRNSHSVYGYNSNDFIVITFSNTKHTNVPTYSSWVYKL
eukprot:470576_1